MPLGERKKKKLELLSSMICFKLLIIFQSSRDSKVVVCSYLHGAV